MPGEKATAVMGREQPRFPQLMAAKNAGTQHSASSFTGEMQTNVTTVRRGFLPGRGFALAGLALGLMLLWAAPASAQTGGDPDNSLPTQTDSDADGSPPTQMEGTLRLGFDLFFAGVEITVADLSGTEIGRATTDSDGRWSIEVPGGGTYVVTLVAAGSTASSSLPHADAVNANSATNASTILFRTSLSMPTPLPADRYAKRSSTASIGATIPT